MKSSQGNLLKGELLWVNGCPAAREIGIYVLETGNIRNTYMLEVGFRLHPCLPQICA